MCWGWMGMFVIFVLFFIKVLFCLIVFVIICFVFLLWVKVDVELVKICFKMMFGFFRV